MSQELSNCHEVLGVAEGASAQELKIAYRDLAKVWHPDRFAHDPRLQQKAQEKLKEINEAYEQLTLGKSRFRKQTSRGEARPHTQHTQRNTPRAAWQLAVLPVCVFTVVLLVLGYLLIARRETAPQNPAQEVESRNVEQPFADEASETIREQPRAGIQPRPQQLAAEAIKEPRVERAAALPVTPLPTVTLTIDPTTGLIASKHCPIKSKMTYADGTEPRQHCTSHQANTSAPDDPQQKESRIKSLSKRLASPTKWFGGKEKTHPAGQEAPPSPNAGNQN